VYGASVLTTWHLGVRIDSIVWNVILLVILIKDSISTYSPLSALTLLRVL
jgi:hypothetical protein